MAENKRYSLGWLTAIAQEGKLCLEISDPGGKPRRIEMTMSQWQDLRVLLDIVSGDGQMMLEGLRDQVMEISKSLVSLLYLKTQSIPTVIIEIDDHAFNSVALHDDPLYRDYTDRSHMLTSNSPHVKIRRRSRSIW